MGTCLFLLKTPLSWIVVVAGPVVTFATFLILGFLSIFVTSTVLIFSTLLFLVSERKLKSAVEPVERDHIHEPVEKNSPQMEDVSASSRQDPETEVNKQNSEQELDWSDEDSLIEISLPGGHYVKHKEDQPTNQYSILQQKLPDFMPETIFQRRSLMELLSELNDMNEEDNLIEIDISMGSIKCSRF